MHQDRQKRQAAQPPRLEVEIAGVKFKNPVMTASGTFAYGLEFAHLMDLNAIGGIVVKDVTPADASRFVSEAMR